MSLACLRQCGGQSKAGSVRCTAARDTNRHSGNAAATTLWLALSMVVVSADAQLFPTAGWLAGRPAARPHVRGFIPFLNCDRQGTKLRCRHRFLDCFLLKCAYTCLYLTSLGFITLEKCLVHSYGPRKGNIRERFYRWAGVALFFV